MAKSSRRFDGYFDSYTLVGQIGSGASGTVFEVGNSEGKHVALKLLTSAAQSKLKRFKNEINFCLRPVSTQIVQVLDFGKEDQSLFYVMPLYSGSLKKRIASGINPGEVLRLFNRMLDGVEAAHLHGVVHRDLKPANVLCDGPDNLVLADFGIAHFQEFDLLTLVETDSQERLGNYQYSAPEQRIPGALVDQRLISLH